MLNRAAGGPTALHVGHNFVLFTHSLLGRGCAPGLADVALIMAVASVDFLFNGTAKKGRKSV
jgi:hypothetical protein